MAILDKAKEAAAVELEKREISSAYDEAVKISNILTSQNTLLYEMGDEDILKDAFEDGSSVVCAKCGALVARARSSAHTEYWCEFASDDEN